MYNSVTNSITSFDLADSISRLDIIYQILVGFAIFSAVLFVAACFAIISINHHLKDLVDLEYKRYQNECQKNTLLPPTNDQSPTI